MTSALEKIVEYPLYWKDLEDLSDDQKALLALVSYAASELNALNRIYLFAAHDLSGNVAVDAAMNVQRFVLLRSWSAKFFELNETVQFLAKPKGTNDSVVRSLAEHGRRTFTELEMQEGYEVARIFRNEAANHYSFSAAKKNLDFVPNSANCKFYLHEKDGNSVYPLGEEVMFTARLNRLVASIKDPEEKKRKLEVWLDWNLVANKWVRDFHSEVARRLVFDRFKDRIAVGKTLWMNPELVGRIPENRTPVYLRVSE